MTTIVAPAIRAAGSWDDARAHRRLRDAFDWADRVSERGCWAWCLEYRPSRRDELDAALDAINLAFGECDPALLANALRRFQSVVRHAVAAYMEESRPEDRERARRQQRTARERSAADLVEARH